MRPQINIDMRAARGLDPRVAFTRASGAARLLASGVWRYLPAGAPRFQHDALGNALGVAFEAAGSNGVRNPSAEGAVAGTPGTAATNWSITVPAGIAVESLGRATLGGINGILLRYTGTVSVDNAAAGIDTDTTTGIAASPSDQVAASVYVAVVNGTLANVGLFSNGVTSRNSGGGSVSSNSAVSVTLSTALQRVVRTGAIASDVTTARVQQRCSLAFRSAGAADVTIFVGWPQVEVGATAPSTPIIPASGAVAASTRSAESFTALLSSWGATTGLTTGTLLVAGRAPPVNALTEALRYSDGTSNNRISITRQAGRAVQAEVVSGGSSIATLAGATVGDDGDFVLALGFEPGAMDLCLNGGAVVSAAPASIPAGLAQLSASAWGGTLSRVAWWPRRLDAATLQALTV